MQSDVKQVFFFHAAANSIGGYLEEPFRVVPTPSSVALSPTGGSATSSVKDYRSEEGVSISASHTHVSGRPFGRNGPWTQRVVSVVEGLNLLDRVTADLLIAQIFIEQPAAGEGERKISFAGSKIENLRIDGKPATPVLNCSLLPPHHRDVDAYNQEALFKPQLKWPALRGYAYSQALDLLNQEEVPAWVRERFGWIEADPCVGATIEGYTLCSLVNQIDGVTAGPSHGHSIELPDFGRIFLAEVTILPYSAHLAMLRAELGCKVTGQISAAGVVSNGTTMPPNRRQLNS